MSGSVLRMPLLSWRFCLVLLMVLWSTQACFIRNCPRGGKRSLGSVNPTRQCMSCGTGGIGQCVGPSICCGPGIGCLMGTPETEVCQKENESSTPCSVKGRHCGTGDMGNCVADGICCVEDACSYNSLCRHVQEETQTTRGQLLAVIRRLLGNRQYD